MYKKYYRGRKGIVERGSCGDANNFLIITDRKNVVYILLSALFFFNLKKN